MAPRSVRLAAVRPDSEAPIGIFDSGFGGLTVARAVIDQLPNEDIVYLGDTARAPYGEQPIASVREFALECLDHLVAQGVKMLVIACNSGSAAVLRDARERYAVPVVEVILPAARRAVSASRTGRVGVICTEATATSQAYDDAFAVAPQVKLTTSACPRFVSFVEAGITGGPELLACAEQYLRPLQEARIDTLILGCTHYPLLTGVISLVLGDRVSLVSSADECAKEVYAVLTRLGLTHDRTASCAHVVPAVHAVREDALSRVSAAVSLRHRGLRSRRLRLRDQLEPLRGQGGRARRPRAASVLLPLAHALWVGSVRCVFRARASRRVGKPMVLSSAARVAGALGCGDGGTSTQIRRQLASRCRPDPAIL